MKTLFILFFLTFTQVVFAQQFDSTKISNHTVVNLLESEFIGFEHSGIVYYVENDLKTIVAFDKKDNKVKWKFHIILACGNPSIGKPEIRYLKLHKGVLYVTYGKHNQVKIEPEDANIFSCGSD